MSEHKTNCSVHNPQVGADSCDCGADEIERLERELAASEAQAATMREALEYAKPLVAKWCHYQGSSETFHRETIAPIESALSTDAGRKVLDVVEAARELAELRGDVTEGDRAKLRQALAAMGK